MTIKITDPDQLRVGTEIVFDFPNLTYTLIQAGNLGPEGVSMQAVYSKMKELWFLPLYQPYQFPMYVIDAEAGKYQIGTNGDKFSGWKPADDATRNLHRDGGWEEYKADGTVARVYAGIKTPAGSIGDTDQAYYQRAVGGAAANFVFAGPVNEGVQVYGDAANGNFDDRTYFKVFVRPQGKTYSEKTLVDGDYLASGPRSLAFFVASVTDLKITASDATIVADAPYTGINVTYYNVDQNRTIGGVAYPFRTIIDGANATAEQIYAKVQYLLRQNADIDAGGGVVTGKTANSLLSFIGDTLVTAPGVYIDNFNTNDTNRIEFYDKNNVKRTFPFVAAGTLAFNSNLVADAESVYRMYFKTNPAGNYGTANAVTVKDAAGNDITGTVSGAAEIAFDFAYDSNVQGGRAAATDATVVVVAIGKSGAKPVTTEFNLTRAVGQRIALVAEKERSYLNA